MTVRVSIELECGERTCASKPGEFCRFLVAKADGSWPRCVLFGQYVFDGDGSIQGWLLRCSECLAAERKEDEEQA